ncbi:MAG: hypothetical protein NUV80_01100 [Candidatus Berkelbacteria bacterium]|nr:hypothetical protein [Candidatus Berkelbacteria bacterium]
MRNDFNKEEVQRWFGGMFTCWWCGKNHADAIHHVLGRETNNLLSAAPVGNWECHLYIHSILKRPENKAKLLQKTMRYLLAQGYELNEKDGEFIMKYKEFYLTSMLESDKIHNKKTWKLPCFLLF